MAEWLVRLKGHGFDLEELSDHFRSPERNVKTEEDGHYHLRSTDFDSLADDGAVRERPRTCGAYELGRKVPLWGRLPTRRSRRDHPSR